MLVLIILNTVQSLSRSCPRIVWYFATRPFCSRNPKQIPVIIPRARLKGDSTSNMVAALLAKDQKRRRDRDEEGEADERPALHGELQGAANAMPTRAAAGDPGAKDHDSSSDESRCEA